MMTRLILPVASLVATLGLFVGVPMTAAAQSAPADPSVRLNAGRAVARA